jgi:2,4-dienoyl-CoA reductase-like NADH-dependent reductase (Old Yellow Enzyme family)/NADPH-dependent 2,4-dienoyl-CoA reductase/sulfur reductase-like enzyme
MPAIQTRGADEDGFITDRLAGYYEARAKGGAGLVIVQQSFAWPEAKLPRGIALWDDKYIAGLSKMAQAIQSHGAKAAIQLGSRGTMQGLQPVAPSPVPTSWGETPRELTREDIAHYVVAFAEAAYRIRKAGFDGLEIHGAHGHLVSMFLSPYTNRRKDEYGGSIQNRVRFATDIISYIRGKVGPDFPLLFRMNADDFIEGGITPEEAVEQARLLVGAGVDALHVSGSCHETMWDHQPTYLYPRGNLVHLAVPIKRVVSVPVITVGKINDPVFAEQILSQEKADFVAMGRALIADPDLPQKAREGRLEDIRHCLYCANCQTYEQRPRLKDRGFSCTVNPAVLREREFDIKLAPRAKKVMVIGGGLAGMEAASTLAKRGHQVSLYEREDYLGGQWAVAAWPEQKTDYKTLIPYMEQAMKTAGVSVHLNTIVDRGLVEKEKPDVVIMATGAVPRDFDVEIPEDKKPNILQANDVITGKAKVGNRVVVVGGRHIGMEVAISIAQEGKHVSLVEALELGHGLHRNFRAVLRNRLVESGVYIYPCSPAVRITSSGMDVANSGSLLHLEADTVVLAIGTRPERGLVDELKSTGVETHAIGDCAEVRDAMEAINDGAEIGRSV